MDKSKIIDEILAEWAMRSPDGLVGGHDTPENMAVLNEILNEARPKGWIDPKKLQPIDPKDAGTKDPSKLKIVGHTKYPDGTVYQDVLSGKVKANVRAEIPFPTQSGEDKKREDLNPEYFRAYHGRWVTDDHPEYPDGVKYEDIRNYRAAKKTGADIGISSPGTANYEDGKWNIETLKAKGFNEESAIKILQALKDQDQDIQKDFLTNGFNKLTPEKAVEFLNSRFHKYQDFIDALDAARSAGGKGKKKDDEVGDNAISTGGAGSKAGRGEFILVLLIEGGQSAGSESGDIKVSGLKGAIEVKEITANGFRATKASFGKGGFYKMKYIVAMSELIGFCTTPFKTEGGTKTRGEVLKAMCGLDKKTDEDRSPETKEVWGRFSEEVKNMTAQFFDYPSLESLNSSAAYGLEAFGEYLRNINEKEAAKEAMPNTVEFDLEKTTTTMKIEAMPTGSQEVVKHPTETMPETPITMTVAPITKAEEEKTRLIIPAAKRLEFFKFRGNEKDIYTPENIAKEMFSGMKSGHYGGGIIFYSRGTGFYYEPDLENLKHGSWYFYSYQQTGPFFVRDEKAKPSE
jgi:hypothetical protein